MGSLDHEHPDEDDPYRETKRRAVETLHMAWFVLALAGLFEVAWAIGLKYTKGFTRPLPTVLTVGAMVISMVLLARAARTLPLGTAYAVWVGIGTVGATVAGVLLFGEPATLTRLVWLAVLVAGIVGLKASS